MTASNTLGNDDFDPSNVLTSVPPALSKHFLVEEGEFQRVTVPSFVQICITSQCNAFQIWYLRAYEGKCLIRSISVSVQRLKQA